MTRDEAAKHLQAVLDGRIRGTRKDTDAVRTILSQGYAPEGKEINAEGTLDLLRQAINGPWTANHLDQARAMLSAADKEQQQ